MRHLGATVVGVVAGTAGFAGVQLAGYLLYQRVWGDSLPALVGVLLVAGAGGLYAGWILGMIVFSAVRGAESDGEPT
jgi:hypothetical protein